MLQAGDYPGSSARADVHGADDPRVKVGDLLEWERMRQTDTGRRADDARHLLTDRERAEARRLFNGEAGQVVGREAFLLQVRLQQTRPHGSSRGQSRKPSRA